MEQASYVSGTSDVPLLGDTIGVFFDRAAERYANREAVIVRHQGVRWTFREFKERVDALAVGLLALGFVPGDRIGIWSPNNAQWVLLQYATAKAGLILVCINPAYRTAELEHALKLSGCRGVVIASRFKSSDYLSMLRSLAPELDVCAPGALQAARLPALEVVIHLDDEAQAGMIAFDEVMALGTAEHFAVLEALQDVLQFDDPINIQFTSGTTGLPKGATLSHHNILNNGYFCGRATGLREGDRLCIPVPLYHCFGMVMSSLACVTHGATMVFPGEGFDALSVLEAVHEERCTALHGVPTMFIAVIEHPEFKRFDVSSLRAGIMAGSPCPVELMKRVLAELNMSEVTIAFGMTETSPVSFQSAIDESVERRVSTVGRIMPHLEAKVVDAEGRIVPRGMSGEILVRGYSVMCGYWDDPERTAQAIDAAGWMHTGDTATIDDAGYCNIVGRIKDMVIRGGENIYPREIEEYLFRHPHVEAAQVFGVPDAKFGEELCAWIKPRAGHALHEDDIRDFCRGQIAHYKVPRYIFLVEAFPMTVTGKVQKFVMREQVIAELGLNEEKTA